MRSTTKATERPFGIEYLEPVQVSPRGGQAPDCCTTYNSSTETTTYPDGTMEMADNPYGSAFCDSSDSCVPLAG